MKLVVGIIAVCTIALSNNPSDMLIKLPTYVTNLIHCGRVTGQGYDYVHKPVRSLGMGQALER